METKICKECHQSKSITEFRMHSSSSKYRRAYCNPCHNRLCNERKARRRTENPDYAAGKRERRASALREQRQSGVNIERFVLQDSRRADKKKGRGNDLTLELVRDMIEQPCSYCGAEDCRMTIDRVDNAFGHLQTNVVPACHRCNIVRGSMPHDAWMELVAGMRSAREKGLFGDWLPGNIGPK
jgi:hypothetical protein